MNKKNVIIYLCLIALLSLNLVKINNQVDKNNKSEIKINVNNCGSAGYHKYRINKSK